MKSLRPLLQRRGTRHAANSGGVRSKKVVVETRGRARSVPFDADRLAVINQDSKLVRVEKALTHACQ